MTPRAASTGRRADRTRHRRPARGSRTRCVSSDRFWTDNRQSPNSVWSRTGRRSGRTPAPPRRHNVDRGRPDDRKAGPAVRSAGYVYLLQRRSDTTTAVLPRNRHAGRSRSGGTRPPNASAGVSQPQIRIESLPKLGVDGERVGSSLREVVSDVQTALDECDPDVHLLRQRGSLSGPVHGPRTRHHR